MALQPFGSEDKKLKLKFGGVEKFDGMEKELVVSEDSELEIEIGTELYEIGEYSDSVSGETRETFNMSVGDDVPDEWADAVYVEWDITQSDNWTDNRVGVWIRDDHGNRVHEESSTGRISDSGSMEIDGLDTVNAHAPNGRSYDGTVTAYGEKMVVKGVETSEMAEGSD